MSNDMISVPRELLERLERIYMDGMSIYGECEEIRALLAQRCTCPSGDGSLRWPCPVCPPEPVAEIVMFGSECKEVAWSKGLMPEVGAKLYRHPPSQTPVMLPGRKTYLDYEQRGRRHERAEEWNACLDEFKRLNPGIAEAAPLRKY